MAEKLTKVERFISVFIYGKAGATNGSVTEELNRQYPHQFPIDKSNIRRLINCLKETGKVVDRPRSCRPKSATDPTSAAVVLATLINSPQNR